MPNCEFTVKEINIVKRALESLSVQAREFARCGFEIGSIRDEIYDILGKLGKVKGVK